MSNNQIKVGISSCLLGDEVRFNGGHTQSKYCTNVLSRYFEFIKYCPEVSAGFSTPRPTMRLYGNPTAPKLVIKGHENQDLSDKLIEPSKKHLEKTNDLCGYILMKKSPSCGMFRVKVYQQNGHAHQTMRNGLFAELLMQTYPALPVEEEGRLNDKALRENFIMRVYAYSNFMKYVQNSEKYGDIIKFHSRYKYMLMAHSQQEYRYLGKLLANSHNQNYEEIKTEYLSRFMRAIQTSPKRRNHINVLQHLFGYLKKHINSDVKIDILNVIEQYRKHEVNLITPLTLLKHYFKQFGSDYLNSQYYLQPYPSELGLQNEI